MAKVDFSKHIWEGWIAGDSIAELEPIVDMIMRGQSWKEPFKTKTEVKEWCMGNQPYYKTDVVNYFCDKHKIK